MFEEFMDPNKIKYCTQALKLIDDYYNNYKYKKIWYQKGIENFNKNPQSCDIIYSFYAFTGNKYKEILNNFNPKKQLKNKMPFEEILDNKQTFYTSLKTYDKFQIYNFTSDDFIFDQINVNHNSYELDMNGFLNLTMEQYEGPWIYKPRQNVGGAGIHIFENILKAQEFSQNLITNQPEKGMIGVYQKYRKDLGLLNKKKFDIRNYLIFSRNELGRDLVYHEQGFIRQTLNDYDQNSLKKNENLANYNIQKHFFEEINYDNFYNTATSDIQTLKTYLKEKEGLSQEKIDEIFHKIKKYLTYIAQSALTFQKSKGHYQIFGMDVIFDDKWNPYILEANKYPGVSQKFYEQIVNKNIIVKEVGDLLQEVWKSNQDFSYQIQLPKDTHLDLLIDQQNNFNYIDNYLSKKQKSHQSDL